MQVTWIRSATAVGLSAALALGSGLAMAQTTPGSGAPSGQAGQTGQSTPSGGAPAGQPAAGGAMPGSAGGSDMEIASKVKAELASKGLKSDDIDVSTMHGDVKLKGKVASKADVKKAEEAAKQVHGVKKADVFGLKAK